MKYIYLVIWHYLFYIVFISCSTSVNSNLSVSIINAELDGESDSVVKLSCFIDSIRFIPIQSDSNHQIAEITDVRFSNNTYYLCDKSLKKIFLIDLCGQVKQVLFKHGRARDEYINIDNFDVNQVTGEISIYDWTTKRILLYGKDCKYLYDIRVGDVVRDFAVFPNGEYVFYTPDKLHNNKRGLWRTNKNGEFIEQLIEIDDQFKYGALYPKFLSRIDSSLIGLMGGENYNRIYHITEDTILIKHEIRIDRYLTKKTQQSEIVEDKNTTVFTKNSYMETFDFMTFIVSDEKKSLRYMFNKYSGVSCCIRKVGDMDEDVYTYTAPKFCDNGKLLGLLYGNEIVDNTQLQKKFPAIQSDSNPVLIEFCANRN